MSKNEQTNDILSGTVTDNNTSLENETELSTELFSDLRKQRKNKISYETIENNYDLNIIEILHFVIKDSTISYNIRNNFSYNVLNNKNKIRECKRDCKKPAIDARADEPWKEKYVLKTLYLDHGYDLHFNEMANLLDCNSETIKKYINKFNISPIDSSDRTSSQRVNKLQRIGAESEGNIQIKPKKD